MPAYIVAIRNSTKNAAELATYGAMAGKARIANMKALAAYGALETLEGEPAEGVVLLEFPDFETAKAWYGSSEYQAAREHRLAGADYRFILFQGV